MKRVETFRQLPKNLPLLFQSRAKLYADIPAQASKDKSGEFIKYSYSYVYEEIIQFALALRSIGIKRGDHVGLISDNRKEWLVTDLAILSLGAADVPRGCDSMGNEIRYILSYAECPVSFFENGRQLSKLLDNPSEAECVKTAVLFDAATDDINAKAAENGIKIYTFKELAEQGKALYNDQTKAEIEAEMEKTETKDLATMIFTSGTTGTPKGVMISHRNILAQMEIIHNILPVKPGDFWLSVLPVWHSFERAIQYVSVTFGSGLAYSKPVGAVMLPDMAKIQPSWMCGVPRLWESLATGVIRAMRKAGGVKYAMFNFFVGIGKKWCDARDKVCGCVCRFKPRSRLLDFITGIIPFILLTPLDKLGDILVFSKIRAKFGGKMQAVISGGGALQKDIDDFYRAINFMLLEGYGMTETSPIISVRDYRKPRPGCVGTIFPSIQIKIVPEENGIATSTEPVKPGHKGLIMAKGDQIMMGYYKRPDLTEKIIDKDGWLNTGDLGMMTLDGEIKITGRAKDTIVLLGGENIEPAVIESALCGSQYIESAVVLGQDKKYLGALIVPVKDMIEAYAKENSIGNISDYDDLLATAEIRQLIQKEIDSKICAAEGFRTCERIFAFALLPDSFQVGVELSAKMEYMRHKIGEKYKAEIEKIFTQN